jgi:carboxymethylenebutenolidase
MLHRRSLIRGLAGLPLAAVLADPRIARAVAEALETVSITTAGGRGVAAALALPETTPAPALLLIHEWWGLNDQIKSVAAELAREGYVALAVDLFDGSVAAAPEEARAQVQALDGEEAEDALTSWIDWLRQHPQVNGKVATLGWCFGGAWSLNASLARPIDATVIYYGRVDKDADTLAALNGPVLGHFGTLDQSITPAMVEGFERALEAAGKPHEIYMYEADHAFANPTTSRYDADDAALAWERTLAFLRAHL